MPQRGEASLLAASSSTTIPWSGPGVRAVLEQAFDGVVIADAASIEQVGDVVTATSRTS